jgi:hypothetical protein
MLEITGVQPSGQKTHDKEASPGNSDASNDTVRQTMKNLITDSAKTVD